MCEEQEKTIQQLIEQLTSVNDEAVQLRKKLEGLLEYMKQRKNVCLHLKQMSTVDQNCLVYEGASSAFGELEDWLTEELK